MAAATTDVEMTEVDVSTAMTVEDDLTETIEADDLSAMTVETTAAIGIAPNATTTISPSGKNAIDVVNQEEPVVAAQTIEDSNAETTDVAVTDLVATTDVAATEEETTDPITEWLATGIAPSATMTTLHGELNATNVEPQRPVAKDGLLAGTTEEETTDLAAMTDAAATIDVAATEEETTDAAEKCSTTTTGTALNVTTQISHSVRNATDVDYPVAAVNPVLVETIGVVATAVAAMTDAAATEMAAVDLAAMTDAAATEMAAADLAATTDVVATEEVAMTDAVATEEAATTDVVATEEVATTDVVATEEVATTDVVATADPLAVNLENNVNLGNSERLVERELGMLTTDHLVI